MKTVYVVPWIDCEWSYALADGYKVFEDKEEMIKDTIETSKYTGVPYIGPQKPLQYYEVPAECLPDNMVGAFTDKYWSPKFKSDVNYINT